jgi:hypothetical protein
MRSGEYPEEIERMKEQADVIIIDEAHHFRNRGLENTDDGEILSRYWKLYDLAREKTVFLLTATPVNNHLTDFQHIIELFSRVDNPGIFGSTLGIHNLPAYFQNLEKQLLNIVSHKAMGELSEQNQVEMEPVLFEDKLIRELVVQRSRAYVRASQEQSGGKDVIFPEKVPPQVARYSVKETYGHLLGKLEKAFERHNPLFALAIYYPLAYWKGDRTMLDQFDVNRQKQVVRLIRILFLKRFESSIAAFESSCQSLLLKLLAFLLVNVDKGNATEVRRLEKWKLQNEELLTHVRARWSEFHEEEESEESDLGEIFLDAFVARLLTPTDDFDALRNFTHIYEGEASPAEQLHLEYQKLLRENPALESFLNTAPLRLFSGKEHLRPDAHAVFFCYRLPAEDKTLPSDEASFDSGRCRPAKACGPSGP